MNLTCLSFYLCICLPIYLCMYLPIYLCMYLSSVRLSVRLSVCVLKGHVNATACVEVRTQLEGLASLPTKRFRDLTQALFSSLLRGKILHLTSHLASLNLFFLIFAFTFFKYL